MNPIKIKLALVDDHVLFRSGLKTLIESLSERFEIVFEANNGMVLQEKIDRNNLPDIILMDVNMPEMNGFETVEWLSKNFQEVKVLVLSMVEKEETVVKMLKLGVKGYLCKDAEPAEFKNALLSIYNKGFYYTDFITGNLLHSLQNDGGHDILDDLNENELRFLKLACSDLTYNNIADEMCLSPKTIDGYRMALFGKFNVKSRVGLALYAVKHGLVTL